MPKFKSVTLGFSSSEDMVVPMSGVTIFVGPNNSGKSLVLREIESLCITSTDLSKLNIVTDFEINWPDQSEIENILESFSYGRTPTNDGYLYTIGQFHPGTDFIGTQVNKESVINFSIGKSEKIWWAQYITRWGTIRLDGKSRFLLTDDQKAFDLLGPPQNTLGYIFKNDELRKELQEILHDAFKLYFVIDIFNLGSLRIKFSLNPIPEYEQSLESRARDYYSKAHHIKDLSDGVQAFTGIVTTVATSKFHTILIDEPEAFLHPPLARKLGKHLSKIINQNKGTLLASTHSSDFIMGCIQSGEDIRIIKMEYLNGQSRGRMIDTDDLKRLIKHPLMKNSSILSALFYDGVIVTESSSDSLFYEEIYSIFSRWIPNPPSILFTNAQNKQTVKEIIHPLRRLGVPAATIVDIDIIKDGGKTWSQWLSSAQIPASLIEGFSLQRDAIHKRFVATPEKDMKKHGGIKCLGQEDKKAALQLFETLNEYGLFIVPNGELESWLPEINASGKKNDWVIDALTILNNPSHSENYKHEIKGDVWDFMKKIISWISNPIRKGLG